mgnify:CR=1 FL=1|jgi:hypothetical protein
MILIVKNPIIMPYAFKTEISDYGGCLKWCEEIYGKLIPSDKGEWTLRQNTWNFRHRPPVFYFTNAEYAMSFKLKWL